MRTKIKKFLRNYNYIHLVSLITLIAIFDEFLRSTGIDKGTRG
jgi:hypothetical protein